MRTLTWRDRIAFALLLLAAISAFGAFIGSVGVITAADPSVQIVEVWQSYGFVVFGGLFSLLAFRPRHYAGVWELVILHKVAIAVTAALFIPTDAEDAQTIALVDGVLAALLIAAYILAKGYKAWNQVLPSR